MVHSAQEPTSPAPLSAVAQAAAMQPAERQLAFTVVAIAFAMELIDGTIINVAIPSIQAGLGATSASIQWMVSGYALAFCVLLVTGGRLGDIVGYKTMFLAGVSGFTLSSVLCGFAWSPDSLVAGRLLQGAAGALMLPQVLAFAQVMYAPHERVAVLGIFGILGGLAAILGPIVGGLIIAADLWGLSWRPIFLINLPIGIAGLLAGIRYLPNGAAANVSRLDVTGTVLVAAAILAILFPIVEGRHFGWPLWGFGLMAVGGVLAWMAAIYFKARMARDGAALVPPALFAERSFSLGLTIIVLFQGAMAGFLLCFTLTLQQGLGFSAVETALVHVPFAAGATFSIGVLSRKVLPRYGPKLATMGAAIMAPGLAMLLLIVGQPVNVWWFVVSSIALLIAGLGMGLISGPMPPITLSNIDRSYAGAAGGVVKAGQNLGSATGAAAIGALFFAITHDAAGPQAVDAFIASIWVVIAVLAAVALTTLTIPKDLKIMTKPSV